MAKITHKTLDDLGKFSPLEEVQKVQDAEFTISTNREDGEWLSVDSLNWDNERPPKRVFKIVNNLVILYNTNFINPKIDGFEIEFNGQGKAHGCTIYIVFPDGCSKLIWLDSDDGSWHPGPWWGVLSRYVDKQYQIDIDKELARKAAEKRDYENKRQDAAKKEAMLWVSKFAKQENS